MASTATARAAAATSSTTTTTAAAAQSTTSAAPWRKLFLSHISKLESPEFVLSTVHALETQDAAAAATTYVPRARYCVFRGMWGELPVNAHNEAEQNERVYESDLLTFTTDVRMAKVEDLIAADGEEEARTGSGGGGKVEAVFWVKEVMTQWRIKGDAYVVGRDMDGPAAVESSGTRKVRREIGERMRVVREEGQKRWSWMREVTAHFGNLHPVMRGSFKNPPPGTPMAVQQSDDKALGLGQKVTDLEDEAARTNFRVVVIKPHEVEQLDLSVPDRARRWRYTYVGQSGRGQEEQSRDGGDMADWKEEELWP